MVPKGGGNSSGTVTKEAQSIVWNGGDASSESALNTGKARRTVNHGSSPRPKFCSWRGTGCVDSRSSLGVQGKGAMEARTESAMSARLLFPEEYYARLVRCHHLRSNPSDVHGRAYTPGFPKGAFWEGLHSGKLDQPPALNARCERTANRHTTIDRSFCAPRLPASIFYPLQHP